ncbi:MAG: NAD(P)/FAD-dependent oxidoreductase [Proteobacteria bacterium]|nr:NAD(P)/FAD-dependent oxidoreductase [Pseudomonadota bacterium]
MSDLTYDVCIIGAGPAGLAAAERLHAAQRSVCLIDRRAHPGTKACGGGLTQAALARIPRDVISTGRPCRVLEVHSAGWRSRIHTDTPYMTLADRTTWQAQWRARLIARGVRIHTETRLLHLTKNGVATSCGHITCGHIIGADGPNSRVRRALGLPTAIGSIALQLRHTHAPDAALLPAVWFWPTHFGAGYAWRFPHPDGCRWGVGVPTQTHDARALKAAFQHFLRHQRIDETRGIREGGNIGCHYVGHRFGRVWLAGDAAGLASPVTGEGISQALISGDEVAKEICCPNYRSRAIARLGGQHRRTFAALAGPLPGARLLHSAAWLLRIPSLGRTVLSRFAQTAPSKIDV